MSEERRAYMALKQKGRDHYKDLYIDSKVILKWELEK
jgi:hypothetical protein